jgi:hypothetical protein
MRGVRRRGRGSTRPGASGRGAGMSVGMTVLLLCSPAIGAFGAVLTLVMTAINLSVFGASAAGRATGADAGERVRPGAERGSEHRGLRAEPARERARERSRCWSTTTRARTDAGDPRAPDGSRTTVCARCRPAACPRAGTASSTGAHRMSEAARGDVAAVHGRGCAVRAGRDRGGAVAFAEPGRGACLDLPAADRAARSGELLTVPSIFFVLLSYLPFPRMRNTATTPRPRRGAGSTSSRGRRPTGRSAGTRSAAIRCTTGSSCRARSGRAGHTPTCSTGRTCAACGCTKVGRQSWSGFAKNAYEGLGLGWPARVPDGVPPDRAHRAVGRAAVGADRGGFVRGNPPAAGGGRRGGRRSG